MITLSISIDDKIWKLKDPVSISRRIETEPIKTSQAFNLTKFSYEPFTSGSFIGDLAMGGSCNVRNIKFNPHNLTHIEVSSHVLKTGETIADLPTNACHGLLLVLDLSKEDIKLHYGNKIGAKLLEEYFSKVLNEYNLKIEWLKQHVTMLGLKTSYSLISEHTDFSNTDPIHLDPDVIKYINNVFDNITGIILDLPSADKEDDGGNLLAHKNFFSSEFLHRFIIELAYMPKLSSELYYCVITPSKVQLDAMITDIVVYPFVL